MKAVEEARKIAEAQLSYYHLSYYREMMQKKELLGPIRDYLDKSRYLNPKYKWITVIKANNMKVWYNDLVGFTFKVTHENNIAYWVSWSDNNNAWIYKTDAKVIATPKETT